MPANERERFVVEVAIKEGKSFRGHGHGCLSFGDVFGLWENKVREVEVAVVVMAIF